MEATGLQWLRIGCAKRADGSGGAAIGVAQCLALAVPHATDYSGAKYLLRAIWAMEVPAMYWGSAAWPRVMSNASSSTSQCGRANSCECEFLCPSFSCVPLQGEIFESPQKAPGRIAYEYDCVYEGTSR
jgi:hypothetical protein